VKLSDSRYWKLSERLKVNYAYFLVYDSKEIKTYIQRDYAVYRPKPTLLHMGIRKHNHT
jgi:rhamnosyltransferase